MSQDEPIIILHQEPTSVVLVADDNKVNLHVMKLLLKGFGIPADFVTDGLQAVEASLRKNYDLILMDIQMPGMDGFQATKRIREREFAKGVRTPIVACSALDLNFAKPRCLEAGVDDYLAKPISRQDLRNTLERWMKVPVQKALNMLISELQAAASKNPINRERIKVLYDTDQIEDILKLFLTVTEGSLEQLGATIAEKDVGAAWPLAHELKAASYAVSAEEMSMLCQQLEQAAKRDDWAEALRVYDGLTTAFEHIKNFLYLKVEEVREA